MTVRNARLPAVIALETLWSFAAVAVFVRLLSDADGPSPSLVAVAALALGSFAVTRLLDATRLTETQARVIAIVASAVALYLIVHTEYAAADPPWRLGWTARLITEPHELLADHRYVVAGSIAATLVWLRGVALWSKPVDLSGVLSIATLAVPAVALAAVVDPPARGPHPFGLVAVVCFLLGWTALALYQTADADEPVARFAARWATAFAVVIAASAVFTFVLAAFDPHTLGFLEPAATAVVEAIGIVLLYTLGPIAAAIGFLFGLIPLHVPHPQQQTAQPAAPAPPPKPDGQTPHWFQIVGYVLAGGSITVLALAFVAAIWFAMRRHALRRPRAHETRRAVERDSMLAEDIGALIDGIARRFRRSGAPRSSIEIRRLYHQMLAHAESDGLARPPAATPLRFAPRLDARYGSDVPSAISRAFVTSRYGLAEVDVHTVRDLRAQWRSVLRTAPGSEPRS
jgi:hypothetical protein